MNNRELRKKLEAAGWRIRSGKAHDKATHPDKPGKLIAVPRHKGEVPTGTAKAILKDAEIE